MSEQRLLTGPAAGLFSGLVLAVVWVAGLNYLYELSANDIVLLLTAGCMGAVGASLATLVMTAAARREKHRLDEAEHLARHDPLTGLTNRAELFNQLETSLTYAAENDLVLGVLFLDLDRFKTINDSLGHEVGDELLRIVADRLKSTVRNTDIVARLGGDEFVVLCRGLMLSDSVIASAKQILKAFKEPISLNGKAHLVSTSIGVAIAEPGDGREADSLVSDADAAMYRAKRAKSGFAVFDEAHRQEVADRLDIERALVHAIESGQIVVYYQPIVDANTHVLYGFEALVRWHHPEKGMIPPGEFLTIAEEAGMMARIGELVLRESCAQMAVWNHAAPGANRIRVGVNLSEQQLTDDSLPRLVAETLAWSGVSPDQLVLEITEDVIVEHLDGLTILRQLRDLGISLSIDDFGTGQSSLSYVKQFDMVSTLKIDQSFVRDMESANADRAIIEAVVAMATALKLKIVAEGVEYSSQLDELRALGVTLIQGYLFGAPMPADQIDPLVMFSKEPRPMPFLTNESQGDSANGSANGKVKMPNVPAQLINDRAPVVPAQPPRQRRPQLSDPGPTPSEHQRPQTPALSSPTAPAWPAAAAPTSAVSAAQATPMNSQPAVPPATHQDQTQAFTPSFERQTEARQAQPFTPNEARQAQPSTPQPVDPRAQQRSTTAPGGPQAHVGPAGQSQPPPNPVADHRPVAPIAPEHQQARSQSVAAGAPSGSPAAEADQRPQSGDAPGSLAAQLLARAPAGGGEQPG